ncbi:MAG TPA: carbohydrate kinase family protein [Candidatus Binatia bacterium]|jgi:ribokinase|nr:carbohydrate kinase family protein [Candidatus Binatia bacterium]
MLDIITFGDATLDVFLQLNEEDADVKCAMKEQACQLCFDYADKIPVESIVKVPGSGNASNNAVGSARLGMKAAIVSILGKDDIGETICGHWKEEGLSTKYVRFDRKRGTNYSTVINYRGERTILVFHEKRDYVFPKDLPQATWVYYTSLGKGSQVMHKSLLAYVKKNGTKFCFQPGTFQLKLGPAELQPLIAVSYITVMNKEEAQRIVGDETKSIVVLLKRLKAMGCAIAVITDGPKGSYTYDGKDFLQLGIFDVPVIERTGCGDAFATAFVAALHHGETIAEAMRWGTANSASVISFIGPQKGLLKKEAMRRMLVRFKDIQPKPL